VGDPFSERVRFRWMGAPRLEELVDVLALQELILGDAPWCDAEMTETPLIAPLLGREGFDDEFVIQLAAILRCNVVDAQCDGGSVRSHDPNDIAVRLEGENPAVNRHLAELALEHAGNGKDAGGDGPVGTQPSHLIDAFRKYHVGKRGTHEDGVAQSIEGRVKRVVRVPNRIGSALAKLLHEHVHDLHNLNLRVVELRYSLLNVLNVH